MVSILDSFRRVSTKTDQAQYALLYSIVPGNEWSTRLARKYRDRDVKEALTAARQSPNADAKMRTLIDHMLAGNYAHPKEEALLKCHQGR